MLEATELRNGTYFKYQGDPYQVLKYDHKQVGRGGANICLRAQNLKTKQTEEIRLGGNDKMEEALIDRREFQYLYRGPEGALVFMDPENYQQITLDKGLVGDKILYIKEGETVAVLFFESEPIEILLEPHVDLKVTETEPGVKGDSVSNVLKPAKMETGLEVQVPLFVNTGDILEVDTRSGEYVKRK